MQYVLINVYAAIDLMLSNYFMIQKPGYINTVLSNLSTVLIFTI